VLGGVPEPGPGVLDAARERLWSLVAEEMLALEADQTLEVDQTLPASAERPTHVRRRASGGSQ
jgi:hypothetical protein